MASATSVGIPTLLLCPRCHECWARANEEQLKALRRLNAHLHRVEIITFDQLTLIARQVLRYLDYLLDNRNSQD